MQDDEQLRLLSLFHYIVGGLIAVCSLFPVIHLVFGIFIITQPQQFTNHDGGPPAFFGWLFVGIASFAMLLGFTLAVAILRAGYNLARRQAYAYCLVVAAIECLFMPFGTVLGVFTLITLTRESVKLLFTPPGAA